MPEHASKIETGSQGAGTAPPSLGVAEIKQTIDFTNAEGFRSGVDVLASLQPGTQSEPLREQFVEVHVNVPSYGYGSSPPNKTAEDIESRSEKIDVFFETGGGYLVGFRSNSGTVFTLADTSSGSPKYTQMLTQALKSKNKAGLVEPLGIGLDHASLGTFHYRYDIHQLRMIAVLKTCDQRSKDTNSHYKAALSTLVCMLAEAPRSTIVEAQFSRIFTENGAVDNSVLEVVQYFGDALRVHRATASMNLSNQRLKDTILQTRSLLDSEIGSRDKPSSRKDVFRDVFASGNNRPSLIQIEQKLRLLGLKDTESASDFFSKVGGPKGDKVLEASLGLRARQLTKAKPAGS